MTVPTDLPSSNPGKDTDVLTDVCVPLLHHPVATCPYQKKLNTAETTGCKLNITT